MQYLIVILLIVDFALGLGGMILFVTGSLAIGSYRLRKRLPIRSPISLMHAGSVSIFLCMVLFGVIAVIHRKLP